MAKFLLISVNDINAHGIRMLSACLKNDGHEVSILFMKRPGFPYTDDGDRYLNAAKQIEEYDWVGIHHDGTPFRYSRGPHVTDKEIELLISLITNINPDIIGFSVTAPIIGRVAKLSDVIKKKTEIPVIWGGAGATTNPEECIQYCDFVCIGEGEKTVLDIARKIDENNDYKETDGLCYLENGRIVHNPLSPLIADLDALPFPDIDPEGKYLIEDDNIVDNFSEISYSGRYHVMGARGCPFSCSYCTESYYKKLYSSERFLRRRSPENVVSEIKKAKEIVHFDMIQFEDEVFSLERKWLEKFSGLYKKEINLPFTCYIYPSRNLDQQLKLLKEAGLSDTCLSLQSGSQYINDKIFKRVFKKENYLEIAHKIAEMDIPYYTDVITYNPFENENDLKDTLEILLQIPKPIAVFINKLYILNNTEIDNLVKNGTESGRMNTTPERLFDYYSRLYWLSFVHGEKFIRLCQRLRIFRFFPSLLRSGRVISILKTFA